MFFNVNYPPKTWTPLKTQNNETNCINSYFLFIFFLALIYKQKKTSGKKAENFFSKIFILCPPYSKVRLRFGDLLFIIIIIFRFIYK